MFISIDLIYSVIAGKIFGYEQKTGKTSKEYHLFCLSGKGKWNHTVSALFCKCSIVGDILDVCGHFGLTAKVKNYSSV